MLTYVIAEAGSMNKALKRLLNKPVDLYYMCCYLYNCRCLPQTLTRNRSKAIQAYIFTFYVNYDASVSLEQQTPDKKIPCTELDLNPRLFRQTQFRAFSNKNLQVGYMLLTFDFLNYFEFFANYMFSDICVCIL